MTIEECYKKMGANYQDVIKRLPSEAMIKKFALKFKDDTSFQELETALNEKQVDIAFRAAHTLKGVCMNLGFDHLYKPSFEITESLRAGNLDEGLQLFGEVKKQYEKTMHNTRILSNFLNEQIAQGVHVSQKRYDYYSSEVTVASEL